MDSTNSVSELSNTFGGEPLAVCGFGNAVGITSPSVGALNGNFVPPVEPSNSSVTSCPRITAGGNMTGVEFVEMNRMRGAFIREIEKAIAPFDTILTPTVPCVAPPIAEAGATDEAYMKWNMRIVRNCGLINFLDGCAATIPCQEPGTGPVGLMMSGVAMQDRHILAVSKAIEAVVSGR